MEHLKIFGFFVVLLVGLATTMYVFLASRLDHRPGVRTLRWFLIPFNIMVLVNLTSIYACANLLQNCLMYSSSFYPNLLGPVGHVAYLMVAMAVVLFVVRMRGGRLGGRTDGELYLRAAGPLALYGMLYGLARAVPSLTTLLWIDLGIFLATYVLLLSSLIGLITHGLRLGRSSRADPASVTFGTCYLAIFAVFPFTATMPDTPAFLINVPAMLLANILPVFWLRRFRPAAVTNGNGNVLETLDLEAILAPFNVSARERQVAGYILQGKSNKEIEDELFISASTVKNHIYRLFRKVGVQSRTQLIRLVLEEQPQRL